MSSKNKPELELKDSHDDYYIHGLGMMVNFTKK